MSVSLTQRQSLSPSSFRVRKKESSNSLGEIVRKQRPKISSLFLPIDETRNRRMKVIPSWSTIERTQESTMTRRDANGVEINKKNKKRIRVTFIDNLLPDVPLAECIYIESYKEYNSEILLRQFEKAFPKEDPHVCCACSIF